MCFGFNPFRLLLISISGARFRLLLFALALLSAPPSRAQSKADKARFEVLETTIDQIHAAYRAKHLTARRLTQAYLDRIQAYDQQGPKINAIITLNPRALEEAASLDEQYRKS